MRKTCVASPDPVVLDAVVFVVSPDPITVPAEDVLRVVDALVAFQTAPATLVVYKQKYCRAGDELGVAVSLFVVADPSVPVPADTLDGLAAFLAR